MARRRFSAPRLIVASHNAGKVGEIAELLRPFDIAVVSAGELGLPEPLEDGETFTANAELKALSAATGAGEPALADDSGLVVAALDGRPGIHSARWAGPDKDFKLAMEKLEAALQGKSDRRAHFICVLSLAWPDGDVMSFEGRVDGSLVWPPRGGHGFGYDSMFKAGGHDITFGEMAPADKHRLSHRADAFRRLVDACFSP